MKTISEACVWQFRTRSDPKPCSGAGKISSDDEREYFIFLDTKASRSYCIPWAEILRFSFEPDAFALAPEEQA